MRWTIPLLTLAAALVFVGTAPAVGGRALAAPGGPDGARLDTTIRYLQEVQNADGGFAGSPGGESDPNFFSPWAALALAAAGINPRDQAKPGGTDVYTYIARHSAILSQTTDFERTLLVVIAAGTDPHDFAGIDLVRTIVERQLADGSFPQSATGSQGLVNSTSFAAISLALVREPSAQHAAERAVAWLAANQNPDGSFSPGLPGSGRDADLTASVIEALNAVGVHDSGTEAGALGWLRTLQHTDGGFGATSHSDPSNSGTTAWVAQGLWAAGVDPRDWDGGGGNVLDYLASMQQSDGSIRWTAGDDFNPVWMTAYAAPAFAGQPLPIPQVPYLGLVRPLPPGTSEPAGDDVSSSGEGGTSGSPGGGVISGGGGRGAPLFSKPKTQSRGEKAGGVRRLRAAPRDGEGDGTGGSLGSGGAPDRAGGGGARSATATATASGGSSQSPQTEPVAAGPLPSASSPGGAGAQVSGVVIGGEGSPAAGEQEGSEDAAAGLRGAQSGGDATPWLAIAIGAVIALTALGGSLSERRRTELAPS